MNNGLLRSLNDQVTPPAVSELNDVKNEVSAKNSAYAFPVYRRAVVKSRGSRF